MRLRISRWAGSALMALSLALTVGGPVSAAEQETALPPALSSLFGGSFSLRDQNGGIRTDRDFRGKYMLVFFGYTYCPTICPTNLEHMAWALEELGADADRVQPIFITIDPERDTPELLSDYVRSFGPSFIALTGSERDIAKVAKQYRIHRVKVMPEGSDPGDYLVDHSSLTYLMGPDGTFITLFPHNTPGDEMARRIGAYLASE